MPADTDATSPANPRAPRVAALLAAGGGSRFQGGEHKLLATLRGRPLWQWALAHVLAAGFDRVILVTGAVALEPPADLVGQAGAVLVRHNASWADGQAGSVQLAVQAAGLLGATALTIGLADQPFVTTGAWRAVAGSDPWCRIVVATYDGSPGPNPVRLADTIWPLLPTTGDQGARAVIQAHPEWVCSVACVGSGADIDTLEDLDRWNHC